MGAGGTWAGLPSASELAALLAAKSGFPDAVDADTDLMTVAQWYEMVIGKQSLYLALHDVFDRDVQPTLLHDFFAGVPAKLRQAGKGRPPLLVTTNYDDLLERAFRGHGEEYDLLVYMADGRYRGTFCHQPPGGDLRPLGPEPEKYLEVDPDKRSTIVKLHGFVSREDEDDDSYVVTEDHYIEYLSRANFNRLLPPDVVNRLEKSKILFLGYSLRDWNMRSLLKQLAATALDPKWFAVRLDCDEMEALAWKARGVETIPVSLEEYLADLATQFEAYMAGPQ